MEASKKRLDELSQYQLNSVSISPSEHPGADDAMSYCGGGFIRIRANVLEEMDGRLSEGGTSTAPILTAKRKMEDAEAWLANCAKRYGARMWAMMESSGAAQPMKTSEWLRQNRLELMDYHVAAQGFSNHQERMRGLQAAIGMGLASGSLNYGQPPRHQYIKPYLREDGTIVEGHLRTAPNDSCFDNLSGC
ncbi:hypothetical protein [Halomonas sp. hl-4]|uniref:hypothetical protein n=1 Tax=Halomonas sp. hl-4 TaxID=1761789 RepID=UPI0012FD81ED|nr:hypothetical protein [Halomonas sp. hl-4]